MIAASRVGSYSGKFSPGMDGSTGRPGTAACSSHLASRAVASAASAPAVGAAPPSENIALGPKSWLQTRTWRAAPPVAFQKGCAWTT